MAAGDELLIVDDNPAHREGMRKLFDGLGYVCTAAANVSAARDYAQRKFFPAALVDLDVEEPLGGIELIRTLRESSAHTAVVVLAGRRSFEGAVEGLRLGVVDVVLKSPESVEHLKRVVEIACERYRAEGGEGTLLRDVEAVLEDSFRVMLEMGRRLYHDVSVRSARSDKPRVLVVEPDQDVLKEMATLTSGKDWELASEMTGGAALEKATQVRGLDVVLARDDLPDLSGTMVVRTIQASRPDAVGIVYSFAKKRMRVVRGGRTQDENKPFETVVDAIKGAEEIVAAFRATQRERRVIQAFRSEHEQFLRRYAEVKLRVSRLLE